MHYHYWILRAYPCVIREEFINIGVLVGSAGDDWAIEIPSNLYRLEVLGISPIRARKWLEMLSEAVRDHHANYGWAGSISAICRDSTFQFSPPRSIIADNAVHAAEEIFKQKVLVLHRKPFLRL